MGTPSQSQTSPGLWRAHRDDLLALAAQHRLRSLSPRTAIDFSSNDYLALGSSQRLRDAATTALARGVTIGSGGSRLLRGNDPEHEMLEGEAAQFFGTETALFFSSGYAANLALFSTLPQRGDLVVHDELIHASARDGMRLGRAATRAMPHNDAQACADVIAGWRREGGTGRAWIAVEGLYSMDGDRAPVDALAEVAAIHGACLIVDEAHATGVFGDGGRGIADHLLGDDIITLHTCGKALGCEGALVCGPAVVRDFLVNRARSFVFSTAPSPLMAAIARDSLRCLIDEPGRRDRLWALITSAERSLARCGVPPTGSQIMPLILGDDATTMRVAAAVQGAGFDVRGIRPPTVPAETARLRISLTLNATADDVEALARVLADTL
jgi:8-amino-7-oxononanoate synthase